MSGNRSSEDLRGGISCAAGIDGADDRRGFHRSRSMNTVVALVIAVTKMLLVMLFFMHLRYVSNLTKVVVLAGFFWLAILMTFTLSDYFSRHWVDQPTGWGPSISAPPQP